MLRDLLDILTSDRADLTKTVLCRELNISPARLENMLLVLEQKGKIQMMLNGQTNQCKDKTACPTTGIYCPGPAHCALLMEIPLEIKVIVED